MHSPLTFGKFEYSLDALVSGKNPGPSGLTSTQMKHWGPVTQRYFFTFSAQMWKAHHIPGFWQDRLMTLLSKEQEIHDLNKIRSISLFEIMRKLSNGLAWWPIGSKEYGTVTISCTLINMASDRSMALIQPFYTFLIV